MTFWSETSAWVESVSTVQKRFPTFQNLKIISYLRQFELIPEVVTSSTSPQALGYLGYVRPIVTLSDVFHGKTNSYAATDRESIINKSPPITSYSTYCDHGRWTDFPWLHTGWLLRWHSIQCSHTLASAVVVSSLTPQWWVTGDQAISMQAMENSNTSDGSRRLLARGMITLETASNLTVGRLKQDLPV